MDVDIDGFSVKEFVYKATVENESKLQLASVGTGKLEGTHTLRKFTLRPVAFWIGVPPFAVPVVIIPTLEVNIGAKGDISAGITTSVSSSTTATQGARYLDGAWTPIKELKDTFDWKAPKPQLNANAKAFIGPKLELALYDGRLFSAYADLNGYLRAEVKVLEDPWWHLYGGTESNIGLSSELFDSKFVDLSGTIIFNEETLLASGHRVMIVPEKLDSAKVDTTDTFTARMKSPPGKVKYTWDFGDGSEPVVRMNDSTMTHAFSKDGRYTISVSVYDEEKRDEIAHDTSLVIVRPENASVAGTWRYKKAVTVTIVYTGGGEPSSKTCVYAFDVVIGQSGDVLHQNALTATQTCPVPLPSPGTATVNFSAVWGGNVRIQLTGNQFPERWGGMSTVAGDSLSGEVTKELIQIIEGPYTFNPTVHRSWTAIRVSKASGSSSDATVP